MENYKLSVIEIKWCLENVMNCWTENDVQNLAIAIKYSLTQLCDREKLNELNKYLVVYLDDEFYYNNDGYIQELEIGNLQDITYYVLRKLLIQLEDAEVEEV